MVIVLIPFYIAYFIISNIRFGMYNSPKGWANESKGKFTLELR